MPTLKYKQKGSWSGCSRCPVLKPKPVFKISQNTKPQLPNVALFTSQHNILCTKSQNNPMHQPHLIRKCNYFVRSISSFSLFLLYFYSSLLLPMLLSFLSLFLSILSYFLTLFHFLRCLPFFLLFQLSCFFCFSPFFTFYPSISPSVLLSVLYCFFLCFLPWLSMPQSFAAFLFVSLSTFVFLCFFASLIFFLLASFLFYFLLSQIYFPLLFHFLTKP